MHSNPIRDWANSQNATHFDLAKKIGVSHRSFLEILAGRRWPRPKVLVRLKEISGLSYDEIIPVFTENYDIVRWKPDYVLFSRKRDCPVALFRINGIMYLYEGDKGEKVSKIKLWYKVKRASAEILGWFERKYKEKIPGVIFDKRIRRVPSFDETMIFERRTA